jgi:hypothetical protein
LLPGMNGTGSQLMFYFVIHIDFPLIRWFSVIGFSPQIIQ